ncbi:hypothetical protein RFI_32965, partial [Reticulomyxa filosa]
KIKKKKKKKKKAITNKWYGVTDTDVLNWNSASVTKWTQTQPPLDQYASKLEAHGIDGMMLLELDGDDLAIIGIKPSHREKILDILRNFAKQTFPEVSDANTNIPNGTPNTTPKGEAAKNKGKNDLQSSAAVSPKKNIDGNGNGNHNNNNDTKNSDTTREDKETKDAQSDNDLSYATNGNDCIKLNDVNGNSRKRRESVQVVDAPVPLHIQVLKDMADLLSTISGELVNEKVQTQADLIQKKVNTLLDQLLFCCCYCLKNSNKRRKKKNKRNHLKKKKQQRQMSSQYFNADENSDSNVSSPQSNQSGKSSPFAEAEGKPVSGISLPYVNTLEQKKGHRRRQSLPFVNQDSQQREGDNDMMDIEKKNKNVVFSFLCTKKTDMTMENNMFKKIKTQTKNLKCVALLYFFALLYFLFFLFALISVGFAFYLKVVQMFFQRETKIAKKFLSKFFIEIMRKHFQIRVVDEYLNKLLVSFESRSKKIES